MSPALTHWGMTQAGAMTVTVMGQVPGKGMGAEVGVQGGNRRGRRVELWDGGLLRMIRETRHKIRRDDCISMDGYGIVWISEVKQFRPDK